MSDIVSELLDRAYSHKPNDFLCERAAMEIERLQNCLAGYTDGVSASAESNRSCAQSDEKRGVADTDRATLTKEEREAVAYFAHFFPVCAAEIDAASATLRKLLERLK